MVRIWGVEEGRERGKLRSIDTSEENGKIVQTKRQGGVGDLVKVIPKLRWKVARRHDARRSGRFTGF